MADESEGPAPAVMTGTLSGEFRYVFNNGKQILLAFASAHTGTPKILIEKEIWPQFENLGTEVGRNLAGLWREGDRIEARGALGYYQGDLVVRVEKPDDIRVLAP